jgi:uncharacterized protein (DUF427 family)
MAVRMRDLVFGALPELRVHPVDKWVTAVLGDHTVVDSRSAVLVWEPRRVVASYAVPVGDVAAELVPAGAATAEEHPVRVDDLLPPALDPSTAFAVHSCPGSPLTLRTPAGDLPGAGFAPDDPDLGGRVMVEWAPFEWVEEAHPVVGHPHDPFKRIDLLPSDRHVVVSLEGVVLADTRRPVGLYETFLPVRWYLPHDDVVTDLLVGSPTTSTCAYKGHAAYVSLRLGAVPDAERSGRDIGWTYPHPLHEVDAVKGMFCFWSERTDLELDGVAVPRPVTPWSSRPELA